jgi:hypothetical protein
VRKPELKMKGYRRGQIRRPPFGSFSSESLHVLAFDSTKIVFEAALQGAGRTLSLSDLFIEGLWGGGAV